MLPDATNGSTQADTTAAAALADEEIIPGNVRAAGALHVAHALEALRIYDVANRLVELFKQGQLAISRGPVVQALAAYAFDSARLTAAERAVLYARVLGAPGGAGHADANTEFPALWLRFVSAVAEYMRVGAPAGLLWPRSAANMQARRAARTLAAAASRAAASQAPAAKRLRDTTEAQLALLGDAQVLAAFGARDLWQVIDRVTRQHLGGAVNVARERALMTSGRVIFSWLATWGDGDSTSLGDAAHGEQPSHEELADAVAQWVAASGVDLSAVRNDDAPRRELAPPPPTLPGSPVQRAVDELAALARIRQRGVGALFSGPRGSGKTSAARRIAEAAGLTLYQINLGDVVAKYLAETERNLNAIFQDAESTGAVLLLDDADLLFSAPGATTSLDALDRHANVELLLQRVADYPGVVVLESRTALPEQTAWSNRLRVVLVFSGHDDR